jgi:hypothetical protein
MNNDERSLWIDNERFALCPALDEHEAFEILRAHAVERNIHGYWIVPTWDGQNCSHVQIDDAVDAATYLLEPRYA